MLLDRRSLIVAVADNLAETIFPPTLFRACGHVPGRLIKSLLPGTNLPAKGILEFNFNLVAKPPVQ